DIVDPYTGPTASDYLNQFRNAKNGVYNGDLAHLVGIHNLGGVAYLDVLCNGYYGVGYSSIYSTYNNVPTYSWTVEVITHELGHNLGSPHTHACKWNGNNTAIDGCGPTAGYSEGCNADLPTNGGTIMSYCHLLGNIGINFNNGFGPQPGDRIRSEVYNAACLTACGGGGPCSYVSINSNNFETGFGIWTDGGTDCIRTNNASYANSPTYSILLRDNTNSSVMSTTNQNWTSYDELTVDFSYYAISFENGEDFWVQISTNGGSSYTTVGDFNAGTQFSNGVHTAGQVVIAGPFTTNTRLRFRADASADDDRVYIDDVVITGCQQPAFNGGGGDRNFNGLENDEQPGITNFRAGPNPATDHINIQFDATGNLETTLQLRDLAGRLVLQQVVPAIEGQNNISVPMHNLTNGLYLLSVQAGEESIVLRVVLAK
ncbi:MAG: zinc-dependent metalloprotease, partial [Saprospiraceae bacterium]|nr:zinc-dependent metalloprotease [Saprospiraceae bacterium]